MRKIGAAVAVVASILGVAGSIAGPLYAAFGAS
jgi:hypothetical protein